MYSTYLNKNSRTPTLIVLNVATLASTCVRIMEISVAMSVRSDQQVLISSLSCRIEAVYILIGYVYSLYRFQSI